MLTFNPSQRITAEDALRHPYLKVYSCTLDEPIHQNPFQIESEVDNLSPPTLRRMIFNESQARSQGVEHSPSDNISIEAMDESDDYRLKLELLGISLRDNSDLDSDEEEKFDFANFEKDFDNATEKSESEMSEKSDEDLKEHKLSLWERQELESRRSSKEIDDLDMEQEKGVIESDSEGSEKSEAEEAEKSEKQISNLELTQENKGAADVEGRSPSPKEKMDKNEALKRQCHQSDGNNKLEEFDKESSVDALSEKAADDKFEKEKSEKALPEDDTEKSDTESVQIELQDKNMYSDEDDTSTSEISNKLTYSDSEKTLEDCLAARSPRHFSGSNDILSDNNQTGDINLTTSLPLSSQNLDLTTQVPNSKNVTSVCVQGSPITSEAFQGISNSNMGEMLYVEIPKPSLVPMTSSSPKSALQAVASHHSPRSRASLSPREKSVRPKKQDWFYRYKSGHS